MLGPRKRSAPLPQGTTIVQADKRKEKDMAATAHLTTTAPAMAVKGKVMGMVARPQMTITVPAMVAKEMTRDAETSPQRMAMD